jgi:hypothetical protein
MSFAGISESIARDSLAPPRDRPYSKVDHYLNEHPGLIPLLLITFPISVPILTYLDRHYFPKHDRISSEALKLSYLCTEIEKNDPQTASLTVDLNYQELTLATVVQSLNSAFAQNNSIMTVNFIGEGASYFTAINIIKSNKSVREVQEIKLPKFTSKLQADRNEQAKIELGRFLHNRREAESYVAQSSQTLFSEATNHDRSHVSPSSSITLGI